MTLRRRLVLMCAAVVGATVVGAAVVCYVAMRGELRGQVDDALLRQARLARSLPAMPLPPPGSVPLRLRIPELPVRAGAAAALVQVTRPGGEVLAVGDQSLRLPVTAADRAITGDAERLTDRDVDGTHLRTVSARLPGGELLQIARSLEGVDRTLGSLRLVLGALCLAGVALALLAARLLTRPVIAPIAELTAAAEHVGATGDLGRRVPVAGDDEVGRLGARFNAMLDQLAASVAAQRRLVADASHELRTPVTALRTNAEVLRDAEALDGPTRRATADDVVAGAEELSLLVGDLIELARGDAQEPEHEDVRLDALAHAAVERARRHAPHVEIVLDAEPVVVDGAPDRLARAVNNLLDNAAGYAPAGSRVEVRVADAELTVRDHGPGIDPAEAGAVFDRFHRGSAAAATGRPGSGLGLAIVKQVADAHGATVALEPAPGGGTLARLRFAPGPTGS
jgi:two-component system sensor histidine kinase MprB